MEGRPRLLPTLWFVLVALMLTVYVLLDGFDLGAGALHLFAGRDDQERQLIFKTVGPVWDGNEVWLIATGGVLFFTFPVLYASGFSGFYLPLIIVLWLLMIRGLSLELRRHIDNPLWTQFWDVMFAVGSILLAVFYGAALGNVVRGVPLNSEGNFFQPLWTNLSPFATPPGILDWYTVLTGLLALATLTIHGAAWVALKTEGALNGRCRSIIRRGWFALVALAALATVATFYVSPRMLDSYLDRPYGFVLPLVALAGLGALLYFSFRGNDRGSFLASGAYIVGMMTSTVFGVYPNVLPAVDPANSLTVQGAASSQYSQTVGLVWWSIGMVLAATYFIIIYWMFRGKVSLEEEGY